MPINKMEDAIKWVKDNASALIGAAAGAGVSTDLNGADLGIAGATVGELVKIGGEKLLLDLPTRALSEMEKAKVAACITFAFQRINDRISAGERPRNDGFFEKKINDFRPAAEEIFEGALHAAKHEHELKKVKYIGNIFANASFGEEISVEEVNHILTSVDKLSYTHLVIMSIYGANPTYASLSQSNYDNKRSAPSKTNLFLQQIFDLVQAGYLAQKNIDGEGEIDFNSGSISSTDGLLALLSWSDVVPGDVILTKLGVVFVKLLGFNAIPVEDAATIIDDLG